MAPPIEIHSVTFRPDDLIEIVYIEEMHQYDGGARIQTVVWPVERIKDEMEALVYSVCDVVDAILEQMRNPEPSKPARREG